MASLVVVSDVEPTRASAQVDRPGRWTLARLGAGALRLPVERNPSSASIRYRLPAGAEQGARDWYLIALHFRITFARDSGSGFAYVSGSTNGRTAAQIKFEAHAARGVPRLNWSSLDLIRGRREGTVNDRTVEIRYRNYLQLGGVQSGENTLSFGLKRLGDAVVDELVVLPGSGLVVTSLAPARLELVPVLPPGGVRRGEEFTLGFRVVNTGDRPARDVLVGLEPPRRGLLVRGEDVRRFSSVAGEAAGSFRLRATRQGQHRLVLGARAANANRPATEIAVPVGSAAALEGAFRVRNIVGAALLLGGVTLLLGISRRRRP